MKLSEQIREAITALEPLFEGTTTKLHTPRTALILGSGLGGLALEIDEQLVVSYEKIPHCNASRVPGHEGRFVFGTLAGADVVCLQGRLHTYEGNTPLATVFPLLVAHALGAHSLFVTNAAGAINMGFAVGDLMLITDQINFTAAAPVTFDEDNDVTPAFFDMTHAYTPSLCELARKVADASGCALREGVYLGLRGPMFETPAEIRAFRVMGADAVGMSTIHEVIMASALGMEVCGFSLLSNMAAGILDQPITAEEINTMAAASSDKLAQLIEGILKFQAAKV
ncbi:MAG: purine-nucleoside phosphorylase [Coriobacteriia bacterium]|nr:purine-nucleoside phosphorylase [Coriobacteriia bacterium]